MILQEKWKKICIERGKAFPLGPFQEKNGVNFALFSQKAKKVTLALFESGKKNPEIEIPLDPKKNKTGNIWHVFIVNLSFNCEYAYRIDDLENTWIIDPYSKTLNTTFTWNEKQSWQNLHSQLVLDHEFDWEEDQFPQNPLESLIIYEMHVRGFTRDPSSGVKNPGTFLGIIEKIPYLKNLGVNAIELLPIFEFNETANPYIHPTTNKPLNNFWGYSPVNFFAAMKRYATENATYEFKEMVKHLHRAGIEIILDVVFNHVGEENHIGSFSEIDKETYYLLDSEGKDCNYTGCGNTVNCNHPIVIKFILDVLKYWVSEMHIDGFRFDLASIFCRGQEGKVLQSPPILEAINQDPLLANVKLIAEAWDCGGLYQVGSFPGGEKWAEWNGVFRDVVRRFIKGSDGQAKTFASVLCGSHFLFGKNYHSINFITAHDGFTLSDLVSYQEKHNEDNGEENRDGNACNDSWNCGLEGPTDDPNILSLRNSQKRNFILALMLSLGTPMILMGDEYGHTRDGNNNAYCQDNRKNYFLWDVFENSSPFFQQMITFRKKTPVLHRASLNEEDIEWHGYEIGKPNWEENSRFVAYVLHDIEHDLFIAFNAHFEEASIQIPQARHDKQWRRLVDTALPEKDFSEKEQRIENHYHMHPYSAILLQAN